MEGMFLMGQNPAVGAQNSRLERKALSKLKWLVVRDMVEIESASFWCDSPEIERGELKTDEIETEVFFFPAAGHAEKEGAFTNTQRLLQWREKAVDPPGDCRCEGWFIHQLALRLIAKAKASDDPIDEPLRALDWWYPQDEPGEPKMEAVLAEINGWKTEPSWGDRPRRSGGVVFAARSRRQTSSRSAADRFRRTQRRRLDRVRLLDLLGCFGRDGVNKANSRKSRIISATAGASLGRAIAHHLQSRQCAPDGSSLERTQKTRLVGRGKNGPAKTFRISRKEKIPTTNRRGRRGTRCASRRRALHPARGRARLALRAKGFEGRPTADALRAARVASHNALYSRDTNPVENWFSRAKIASRRRAIRVFLMSSPLIA